MRVLLTSDEVNVLLQRYLLENGFVHAAFAFQSEACMQRNPYWQTHAERVPPNALVSLLQKALLFIHIEYHTANEGATIACDEPFSFFRRHECWSKAALDAASEGQSGAGIGGASSTSSASLLGVTPRSANLNAAGGSGSGGSGSGGSGGIAVVSAQMTAQSSGMTATSTSATNAGQRRGSAASLEVTQNGAASDAPQQALLFSDSTAASAGLANSCLTPRFAADVTTTAGGATSDLTVAASEEALRCKRGGGSCRPQRSKKKATRLGGGGGSGGRVLTSSASSSTALPASASGGWTASAVSTAETEERQNVALAVEASEPKTAAPTFASAVSAPLGGSGAEEQLAMQFLSLKTKKKGVADEATAEAVSNQAPSNGSLGRGEVAPDEEENVSTTSDLAGGGAARNFAVSGVDESAKAAEPADGGASIFIGPPLATLEQRIPLQDFVRLVEVQDVGEAGALSEWNPADPQLLVTNFAVGAPRLYRVPLEICGQVSVEAEKELAGPPLSSGATNAGSSAHWSPDGRLLATGYESGDVFVWNSSGEAVSFLRGGTGHPVICVAFSPSSKFLAAAAADGTVVLWRVLKKTAENPDVKSNSPGVSWSFEEVRVYRHCSDAQEGGTMKGVIDLDWSKDDLLAAGAVDGRIVVLGVTPPCEIFVPLGKRLFSEGELKSSVGASTEEPRKESSAGDASSDSRNSPQKGDLPPAKTETERRNRRESASNEGEAVYEVASVRWDSTGKLLAVVDSSSSVGLWNVEEPALRPLALKGHTEPVIKLEWCTDREAGRRLLITVGMDRLLLVWDVETPQAPIFRLEFDHPPTSLRVNRDASLLAVGTYDSVLRVYALPSFNCIASYIDLQMVIPHITWRSTHDCLAYNVFQMGRTVVLKPPRP